MQRLFLFSLALVLAACGGREFKEGLDRWEGTFDLSTQGKQPATAQFEWEAGTGLLLLPDLIPVPLALSEVERTSNEVSFAIAFRSGTAYCQGTLEDGVMQGVMEKEGMAPSTFSLRLSDQPLLSEVTKPAPGTPFTFRAHGDLPEEHEVIARVSDLLASYDLESFIYTTDIVVQQGAIPHSHPVLTLNTADSTEKDLLATFLHEQMHWYSLAMGDKMDPIGEAVLARYPQVPTEFPEGGGSEQSTYLHLGICFLEYQSLSRILGEGVAREHLETMTQRHYTWVYRTILEDLEFFEATFAQHGVGFPFVPTREF